MRLPTLLGLPVAALLLAACGSDPACPSGHCGSGGGGSGGAGGACPPQSLTNLPTPTTVAVGEGPLLAMAVDATNVYWAADIGVVDKAPKAGEGVLTRLSTGVVVESLVVDGDHLVVMSGDGDILALPTDGSASTTLVMGQVGAGFSDQGALAVDDAHLYWVGAGDQPKGATLPNGYVRRSDKDGTNLLELATGRGFAMTVLVDGGFVYWAEAGSVTGDGMVQTDGTVNRVPIAGGAVEPLATGLASPRVLAHRGSDLWLNVAGGLVRLPAGGKPETVYPKAPFAVIGATDAFFLENTMNSGLLFRAPLAGGCLVPLAQIPFVTLAPVVDDAFVYLGVGSGAVISVPQQ